MSNPSSSISSAPAEIPARLAARAIDAVVLAVFGGLLGGQTGFGFDWLLTTAVVVLGYFVLSDAYWGTTLGKRALNLRVIGPQQSRPTLTQALIRESFTVFGAIPFAGPLLALAAWIWISLSIRSSPLRQGMHDRLAGGTRVVRLGAASSWQDSSRASSAVESRPFQRT